MNRADQYRRATSRVVVLLFVLTIGATAALLVPTTPGSTSRAASPATTVTSPGHAWKWDPTNLSVKGSLYGSPRSVTVDQTENLVSQVVHVTWADFSASGVTNSVNPVNYPVHVYECDRADPVDPGNCFGDQKFVDEHPGYGFIPDQTNTIQTYTRPDGGGGVDFNVLTGADNPALGCAPTHQCSLVVVPWPGGRPADRHTPADCDDHSLDLKFGGGLGNWSIPGISQPNPTINGGCDWASRIVIPLSFAPTPVNCPDRSADLSTEGSPMLRRAVDQWRTGICNDTGGRTGLQVQYTGLSEYSARSDFDRGAVDVGLTSQPATAPTRPSRYAPVGVTSIAVAYYVDDPFTGTQFTDLKLSPRLIAKLLTQSYTEGLSPDCTDPGNYACAPEVKGNPATIFDDPEFQKLNSVCWTGCKYTRLDFPFNSQGNSSPDVVYGLSDNTYQVTQWLAADPKAAAFLSGTPDESGMHVNTAYQPPASPTYPIEAFNANDPGHTLTTDCASGEYSCLVGGLQFNWHPINGLDNVAKTLVSGKNTATLYYPVCDGNNPPIRGVCSHYVSASSEPLGSRGLFAIVSGGDAAAYQFPTAQLETHTGSNKFVALTGDSMTAALGDMKPNADGTTRRLVYSSLNDPDAYPLTTVSYAMVPTCGLPSQRAAAVAAFLDYTASDEANTSGVEPGQLAPGYLPMPADMRSQTHDVAGTVATEHACPTSGGTSTSSTPTRGSGAPGGVQSGVINGGGGLGIDNAGNGVGASSPAGSRPATSAPTSSASEAPTASAAQAAYRLPPDSAGAAALILPVALCIGAGLLLTGPAMVFVSRRGGLHLRRRR